MEEFAAEKAWWGNEANDFAERQESERAWRVDFKAKKQDAEARAKPHWDKAEEFNDQASVLNMKIRDVRAAITSVKKPEERFALQVQIVELHNKVEQLRLQARDAQATGDGLYWPIYNLDIKNPKAPQEESLDPDVLLRKYKILLADIGETQEQLKSELGAALAHHFEHKDT